MEPRGSLRPRRSPTSNLSSTEPELQREAIRPKLMCPNFYYLFHYLAYVLYSTGYGNQCLSSQHRNTISTEIHQVWQPPLLIPSLWEDDYEASLAIQQDETVSSFCCCFNLKWVFYLVPFCMLFLVVLRIKFSLGKWCKLH